MSVMIETTIPFSGFYDSIWSGELDECDTRQIEQWQEDEEYPGVSAEAMQDVLIRRTDYRDAEIAIAKAYVEGFQDWINHELGVDITLTFSIMTSPKEYNFTTDRIFVNINRDDLAQVYKAVGRQAVRDMAKEMFTSRSGFISFYSPRIEEWGPIREWDYNQVGAIFAAAVRRVDQYGDLSLTIYEGMSEDIYRAWSNAVDWPAVEQDLNELQIEAEDGIEDARVFPPHGVSDTSQYVKQFCELNHMKGDGDDVEAPEAY